MVTISSLEEQVRNYLSRRDNSIRNDSALININTDGSITSVGPALGTGGGLIIPNNEEPTNNKENDLSQNMFFPRMGFMSVNQSPSENLINPPSFTQMEILEKSTPMLIPNQRHFNQFSYHNHRFPQAQFSASLTANEVDINNNNNNGFEGVLHPNNGNISSSIGVEAPYPSPTNNFDINPPNCFNTTTSFTTIPVPNLQPFTKSTSHENPSPTQSTFSIGSAQLEGYLQAMMLNHQNLPSSGTSLGDHDVTGGGLQSFPIPISIHRPASFSQHSTSGSASSLGAKNAMMFSHSQGALMTNTTGSISSSYGHVAPRSMMNEPSMMLSFKHDSFGGERTSTSTTTMMLPTTQEGLISINSPTQPTNEEVIERQKKRKENHNAVERRRRDLINVMISRLALLITTTPQGSFDHVAAGKLNKGEVLEGAVKKLVTLQNALLDISDRLACIDCDDAILKRHAESLSTLIRGVENSSMIMGDVGDSLSQTMESSSTSLSGTRKKLLSALEEDRTSELVSSGEFLGQKGERRRRTSSNGKDGTNNNYNESSQMLL